MIKGKTVETHFVVVCPTEYGGQIEHAADVAQSVYSVSGSSVKLVTRPGATQYLGRVSGIELIESLPGRRTARNGVWKALRPFQQAGDLLAEHLHIRRALSSHEAPRTVMILDATRYPFPRLLVPRASRERTEIVMFLHNVIPHDTAKRRSLRRRLLSALEASARSRVDLILVHGDEQRSGAQELTSVPIVSVPLPGSRFGAISSEGIRPPEFLPPQSGFIACVGEVRANKGIEVAIRAAAAARIPIVIAGHPETQELAFELCQEAAQVGADAQFIFRFLSPEEFVYLLRSADTVVLPYLSFGAQSGVAARAAAVGRRIVASDLPALREQLRNFPNAQFFRTGDFAELALELTRNSSAVPISAEGVRPEDDWAPVARAIIDAGA